jgi:HD-like signal output (HDOD) protein
MPPLSLTHRNPDNITRVELNSLAIKVARSENLPVLPEIISSVLKLADDPNASGRAMEKLIERDPAITAKILRVANSSYYGMVKVPTIGRALGVLGMNTIRSLVIGVAYQQVVAGRAEAMHFNKLSFWRHSLAVATGARIIGKMKMPLESEELYGAGMLHDVGMLVMDRFCPDELDQAIRTAQDENCPLHLAEKQVCGFDHSDAGGLLAEKWGLPDVMSSAILYHHNVLADQEHFETTCIVAAANTLAHQCGLINNNPSGTYELDPVVEAGLNLPTEQLAIIGKVMYEEVMKAQSAFQIC